MTGTTIELERRLRERAHRLARRGETRKAVQALREAANLSGSAAAHALLGGWLARVHLRSEAAHAFRQSLFLHVRAGAHRRARTVARILLELDPSDRRAAKLLNAA